MKIQKILAISLVLLLVLGALTGCASNDSAAMENFYAADVKSEAMESELYGDAELAVEQSASGSSGATGTLSERKLIKTFDLDAETEDLDALLEQLSGKIVELGGYVERQELYNGSAYASRRNRDVFMCIRIPADRVNQFITHVSDITNIISQHSDIDDVTLTYVATESRVNALQTEETRLLELMEQAETMTDLLEVEARLTDVRYELESVTSQLNVLKNQVSYSTVNLSVSEVQQYTPVEEETFWQRVTGGFQESLEDLSEGITDITVFLLTKLPYILLLGAGVLVTLLIVKLATRKPKQKKNPSPDQSQT